MGRDTFLTPFLVLWQERVGLVNAPRAAAALKPAIDVYGADRVLAAMRAYLDNPAPKVRRMEYFVQDVVRYLPQPPAPLVDEFGDLTNAGVRAYYGGQ